MVTKKCLHCGKNFIPKHKNTKFCSFICSGKHTNGVKYVKVPKGMKYCTKCKRILPIEGFQKERAKPDGLKSSCKFCTSIWTRKLMTYDEIWNMLLDQKWKCAICGDSLKKAYNNPELIGGLKTKHLHSISIDHIDPNKEKYQLVHQICNVSKSNRNMEELRKWCKKVLNTTKPN